MSFGVVPYLMSPDADKHVEWMKNALGGEVKGIHRTADDAKLAMHCDVAVNGGHVYLADRRCKLWMEGGMPTDGDGEPKGFFCQMELENPKEVWDKAMKNDAMVVVDLKVQFWGDLYGVFRDPFGFPWSVIKVEGDKRKPGVVPYLLSPPGKCDAHMEWLKDVCGAEEKSLFRSDDGKKVMHAEMGINQGAVCMAESGLPLEEQNGLSGTPSNFHCHVCSSDAQTTWDKALKKEAKSVMDYKVQFWGDRYGMYKDPFGFVWSISEPCASDKGSPANGVIPCIISSDCKKHIEWVKNVFDGKVKQIFYCDASEEKVKHCSMLVNEGYLYLSDNVCLPEQSNSNPPPGDKHGVICHINVPDPELVWKKAMGNGATAIVELKVQDWGELYGCFRDTFGFEWSVRKQD